MESDQGSVLESGLGASQDSGLEPGLELTINMNKLKFKKSLQVFVRNPIFTKLISLVNGQTRETVNNTISGQCWNQVWGQAWRQVFKQGKPGAKYQHGRFEL